jgi:AcrR family transcriptional regulator
MNKREAVMQATLEIIADNGFHASPIALIAQKSGVATGSIYRYFENKDVLIRETYACLEGQMLASINSQYPELQQVRERFLHICRRLINYFIDSPTKFRFVEQFHNSPYGVACRRDKIMDNIDKNIIMKLFEEGRQQQNIKDLPMTILFALTFGPLVTVCRDHILGFQTLDEQLIEKMIEACWDAVKV